MPNLENQAEIERYMAVAQSIAKKHGRVSALWQAVQLPDFTLDYGLVAKKGEKALAAGVATPHLRAFVDAAHQERMLTFLNAIKDEDASDIAKMLASDPEERLRWRNRGYAVP